MVLVLWKKGTPKGGVIGGAGSEATTGKVTVFQVSPLAEMAELLRPGDGRRRVTKLVGITVTRS